MNAPRLSPFDPPAGMEARQARFALRVGAALEESAAHLPHDVTERLRFAREQALERAALGRQSVVPSSEAARGGVVVMAGAGAGASLSLAGGPSVASRDRSPWWGRLATALPLLVLAAGLLLIQESNHQAEVTSAAELDTALLADDLPPAAYSDPGFAEFLKTPEQ